MVDQEVKKFIDLVMGSEVITPKNMKPFSIKKTASEVNIVDLKGRSFRFPGPFLMSEENGIVTFKAKSS